MQGVTCMLAVRKRTVKGRPSFAKKAFPSSVLFSPPCSLSHWYAWWAQLTLLRRRVSKLQVLAGFQQAERGGRGTAEVWDCQYQTSSLKQSQNNQKRREEQSEGFDFHPLAFKLVGSGLPFRMSISCLLRSKGSCHEGQRLVMARFSTMFMYWLKLRS